MPTRRPASRKDAWLSQRAVGPPRQTEALNSRVGLFSKTEADYDEAPRTERPRRYGLTGSFGLFASKSLRNFSNSWRTLWICSVKT